VTQIPAPKEVLDLVERYAWSAKLPLSVLTDFEEFAVYDCRIKPSSAACKRKTCNGWTFWRYERSPGDWIKLDALRK
jgi:hypothetical protein